MGKIAFVTGGTGFIGSHLVEELRRRGYDEIRCLVRSQLKWLKGMEIEPVRGDLSDIAVLWDALRDVDYVYHVAGLTRATDPAAFDQANVKATMNLLGAIAMARPGLSRVLITSSLAAVGRCPGGVASEETPLDPISLYGASKAAMERALTRPREDEPSYRESLPITVVRPPAVYGPREADIYTVFKAARHGLFPVLGRGDRPDLSLVHARDLVRGMVDAAESEATVGKTYFLGSESFYSWNEIKHAMESAFSRRIFTVRVPIALIGPVGAAAEVFGRLSGTYPPLNREKAREIREACKMCSIDRARADFGYRPRVPLEEGIAETAAWYKKEGWL